MRLTRLHKPDTIFKNADTLPLNPEQAHYMTRVLRLESGAPLVLFNEISGGWLGHLIVTGRHAAVTLDKQVQPPTPPLDIHLLVAPVKKEAWQFILEKATELNVAAIQPVLTDYTQSPRINTERARANLVEASQQCERTHVPQFFAEKKLESVLTQWERERILYAALERHDTQSLAQTLVREKPAALLIGPEGGFSAREKELLLAKPFVRPVSLGPLILRSETAAIAGLAIYAGLH